MSTRILADIGRNIRAPSEAESRSQVFERPSSRFRGQRCRTAYHLQLLVDAIHSQPCRRLASPGQGLHGSEPFCSVRQLEELTLYGGGVQREYRRSLRYWQCEDNLLLQRHLYSNFVTSKEGYSATSFLPHGVPQIEGTTGIGSPH